MKHAELFSRIETAIAERQTHLPDGVPSYLFLGDKEWADLCDLCEIWGYEWKGLKDYPPRPDGMARASFRGCAIYRLDAVEFLAVL